MRTLIILLSLFSGIGCFYGDACDGNYSLDPTLTIRERQLANAAAAEVNDFVGEKVITINSESTCRIAPKDLGFLDNGEKRYGHRDNGDGVFFDRSHIQADFPLDYEAQVYVILRHEMLHSAGVKHLEADERGIMNPTPKPQDVFTEADRRVVNER